MLEGNKEIIISSPGINAAKVKHIISYLRGRQESGVNIIVITLRPESYPENRIEITKQLADELMCVVSSEIAQELMEITFGSNTAQEELKSEGKIK